MSLNSFLVTDEIRPLPGSGWTSKNAANRQDSIAKYKEKLNIPRGQKGYIDPAEFKLKDNFDKEDLMNIEPKRSCVVSKPECVQYNYVVPNRYLQDGIENAKVENQILENEYEELEAQHGELTTANTLQQQQSDALQQQNTLIKEELKAVLEIMSNMENIEFENTFDFKNKLQELKVKLEQSQMLVNLKEEELYSRLSQIYRENPNLPAEGGTRHKRKPIKRTQTHKRRTTKRLRSKKIPRKCFSLRKREK